MARITKTDDRAIFHAHTSRALNMQEKGVDRVINPNDFQVTVFQ